MTPKQKLRLARAIWPGRKWSWDEENGLSYLYAVKHHDARRPQVFATLSEWKRCEEEYRAVDLTSNEAVGAMVACLHRRMWACITPNDRAYIARGVKHAFLQKNYPAALARLVLEVIGDA